MADDKTEEMKRPLVASDDSEREERSEGLRDLLLAILFCVIAVVIVRTYLIEPFKIPSSSMVPTLRIGDHIFVSKFPFSLFVPFSKLEIVRIGDPKRGDVVVFLFPKEESLHYIKRVVGLPGDKIEFRGKDLIINGEMVEKERVSDAKEIEKIMGSRENTGEIYREKLGGKLHYVRYLGGPGADFRRSSELIEVPADTFFVAGDNRDDSYDSRAWGPVPRMNLRGRAEMIWLSMGQEGISRQKVRWDRIFSSIQ